MNIAILIFFRFFYNFFFKFHPLIFNFYNIGFGNFSSSVSTNREVYQVQTIQSGYTWNNFIDLRFPTFKDQNMVFRITEQFGDLQSYSFEGFLELRPAMNSCIFWNWSLLMPL
jgi:hypothetical protein